MFDLEKAIIEWRQQMLAASLKAPQPLEELESHLREEIERQTKLGLTAQQAFEIAASHLGRPSELKTEFKKNDAPMQIQKVTKLAGIICVMVALAGELFTCAPIVFALALAHGPRLSLMAKMLPMTGWAITMALTLLSWKYNYKLLPAIQNQLLRRAVGFACYAGCLLWIRFILFHLPFSPTNNVSVLLVVYFILGAEWLVIAVLGGVAYGLEKAAKEHSSAIALSTC